MRISISLCIVTALAWTAAPKTTAAAPLAPGQSISYQTANFVGPTEGIFSSTLDPFDAHYTAPAGYEFVTPQDQFIDGGIQYYLRSANPNGGPFIFQYDVFTTQQRGTQRSLFEPLGYGGAVSTDVSGTNGSDATISISRSSDGSIISFENFHSGSGGNQRAAIRTDALDVTHNGAGYHLLLTDILPMRNIQTQQVSNVPVTAELSVSEMPGWVRPIPEAAGIAFLALGALVTFRRAAR